MRKLHRHRVNPELRLSIGLRSGATGQGDPEKAKSTELGLCGLFINGDETPPPSASRSSSAWADTFVQFDGWVDALTIPCRWWWSGAVVVVCRGVAVVFS